MFGYCGSKGIVLNDKTFIKNLGLRNEEGQFNLLAQMFLDDSHLHISGKSGRGVPEITEIYGKKAFAFRENRKF